ncbi:uncharacterized protein A1O9_05363 [Exophiala aquamarina CBS 119918]|uniref:Heterokaryon incompatibility domain-containing protein n=1 Tax=Exophiala aquamarina CBS 119918 TaxID=1182545 RepID=A0A072PC65_9EURO|nr:uncharacterized protein A1O9_05363 [Exophiala aquamarina CBS 119918]KEF57446.1 hypothetical protein A1O9_05363 [Exophiala aquamarina CBS 119918]
MDFLPRVTVEPAHGQLHIPYLCPPIVDSKPTEVTKPGDGKHKENGCVTRLPTQDEAAALQHSLYFGLLEAATKPDIDLEREDFLTSSSSGQLVVSASRLPSVLKRWRNIRAKRQSDRQLPSGAEMEAQLSATVVTLKSAMARLPHECLHAFQDGLPAPLPLVILSIQALIETIWDTRILQDQWPFQQVVENPSFYWIESPFIDRLLSDAGWLPDEICHMPKDIRFRYYLSLFSRNQVLHPSSRKLSTLSDKNKAGKDHYSAIHVGLHCQCKLLSSKLPATQDLKDSFFLVSLTGLTGSETLQVHQASVLLREDNIPFVAFSHVRADGLGSSESNSLPTCQISLLQQMSNQLFPTAPQPVPFYVDTLCVPLGGSAKRSALRNLQYVFKFARKVLVLDSGLRHTPVGLPQENLTRIRYSLWAKRLWTVQECAVSRDVSFRFLDRNLSLTDLLASYDQDGEFPLLRMQALKDRNLVGFGEGDYEDLATSLELLSDDIHLAESLRHAIREEDQHNIYSLSQACDKSRLRSILRLGLLAMPSMRYFSEAAESADFETVAKGLLRSYASHRSNGLKRVPTASRNPEELYRRLRTIQALHLVSI